MRVSRLLTLALLIGSAGALGGCVAVTPESDDGAALHRLVHPSGLVVEDLRIGRGPLCEPGSVITVHYTGRLSNGRIFDSTRDVDGFRGRGLAMTYPLADLMAGWREGVPGMRVGGRRRLVIPPELAYGEAGRPPRIPPWATLEFVIELVDARAP